MEEDYDDLYDLLLKFTDDNIKEVAYWVCKRRGTSRVSVQERETIGHMKQLRALLCEPVPFLPWQSAGYWENIRQFHRTISKPLTGSMYPLESRDQKQSLRMVEHEIAYMESLVAKADEEQYAGVENYIRDTELLITDLLAILEQEYESRIAHTRVVITNYVEPHRKTLEKLQGELGLVETGLRKLADDEFISAVDKEAIARSLEEKRGDLQIIKKRELENMRNAKAFVDEIRTAQQRFESMVKLLSRKNMEARSRKDYLSLITSLNATVPKLDDTFRALSAEFRNNIDSIRESFYILNMSIKNDLIRSLEDQTILTGILGTHGRGVAERIADSKTALSANDVQIYDIDLSFLGSTTNNSTTIGNGYFFMGNGNNDKLPDRST
ncbi:MAG: hypothetical protein WCQ50_07190 [Spirochaetota bacterium]